MDEQQINLTRFNLFFPEKRDFFLENQGTFAFGGANQFSAENVPILFYSRRIGLESGQAVPIHLREGWAGAQARQAIPAYLAIVAQYLMSNEFHDATIESIKVHLQHDDQLRIAKLLEASVITPDSGRIAPGDTVKVRTLLKPFRGEPFVETFDVKVPDDQAPGVEDEENALLPADPARETEDRVHVRGRRVARDEVLDELLGGARLGEGNDTSAEPAAGHSRAVHAFDLHGLLDQKI